MPKLKSPRRMRRLALSPGGPDPRVRRGRRSSWGWHLGIAAGARETMRVILDELRKARHRSSRQTVGCIGMSCASRWSTLNRPANPITYGNITSDRVPRLIEEHPGERSCGR